MPSVFTGLHMTSDALLERLYTDSVPWLNTFLFSTFRRINQATTDQRHDGPTVHTVHSMIRVTESPSECRRWFRELGVWMVCASEVQNQMSVYFQMKDGLNTN